ncbi:MAG TPA: HTTM domain-containing protein [Planctomycetaceae bacterium]|nr:HTTM domain-containing protein [Planctomycetaceae bacterium]
MSATDAALPDAAERSVPSVATRGGALRRLAHRLFEPVDIGLLVFFRIAFGAIMLWEVYRYLSAGRLQQYYGTSEFHFTYLGFDWVKPWSGHGMDWHFLGLGLLAVMIMAGAWYRLAMALFWAGFTYFFLIDQTYYLNHFYLISLVGFLMIWVPAHRAVSVDVLRRPELRSTTMPAWALWLLRFQIAVPYFFGGIAKLNADWLRGEPMRMWLSERFGVVSEAVVYFFTYGGLLLDLMIVPLLLWRRTMIPAYLMAVSFHFLNDNLFNIGIFPWFMVAATLLFCPPEWVRVDGAAGESAADRKRRRTARTAESRASRPAPGPLTTGQRLIVGLLAAWVGVQVLLPFRHFLYPGDVNWTEEGHKFSWHMKLRSKRLDRARFGILTRDAGEFVWEAATQPDPETGFPTRYLHFTAFDAEGRRVDGRADPAPAALNHRQISDMSTEPDMIVQFVRFLADRVRAAGHTPVAGHVDITISLNARPPQQFIDPQANLLQVRRGLGHADWILPLTTPLERPSVFEIFR